MKSEKPTWSDEQATPPAEVPENVEGGKESDGSEFLGEEDLDKASKPTGKEKVIEIPLPGKEKAAGLTLPQIKELLQGHKDTVKLIKDTKEIILESKFKFTSFQKVADILNWLTHMESSTSAAMNRFKKMRDEHKE